MKLSAVFLIITTLSSFAVDMYSQTARLTINLENQPLLTILNEIENKSEYRFFYSSDVNINKETSISFENKNIMELLDELLKGTGVKYEFYGRQIALYNEQQNLPLSIRQQLETYSNSIVNNRQLVFSPGSASQQRVVTGKVTDVNGKPLIGVSIAVKGTSTGTITDINGNFILEVEPEAEVLVISYISMRTQEVDITSLSNINVTLEEDIIGLKEVVAIGFGTQRKVNLTGSVSVVNSEAIESRPVQNTLQALQGLSPGLNISYTNGGLLNTRPEINIRGISTIGQGSTGSALILIDGMEGDLMSINPQDIESVSILKDAAASSIYGSRAPFGVILVTTKRSKSNKVIIKYTNNNRFSTPMNLPEMLDSYSFATYMNDASNNAGMGNVFSEERMQRIWDYQQGLIKESTIRIPNTNRWGDGYDYGNDNIDYYKVYYKKWSPSQDHNLSISGGKDKTTYYFSTNYLNQKGLIAYGEDKFQRFTTTVKTNTLLKDWLTLNISIKYIKDNYTQPRRLNDQLFQDMARQMWPTKPLYDPNGNLFDDHAIGLRDAGKHSIFNNWLYQQGQVIISPVNNWRIVIESNYRINNQHNQQSVKLYGQQDINGNPGLIWGSYTSANEYYYFNNFFNNNVYTDYEKLFKNSHRLKVLAGFQNEINSFKDIGASRIGLLNPDFPSINATTGLSNAGDISPPNVSGMYSEWSTLGFFSRLNYDYKSKYLIEANFRYDGSSRFREFNRWGFFPSVSIGWNVAEETFFNPIKKHVNYLKFRGSYGSLGNQSTTNNYPTYSAIGIGTASGSFIINQARPNIAWPPEMISSSLTWEKITSSNIGLDYGMLKNRLTGSFDYFIRYTNNMVGPAIELPAILGTNVPLANNSDLKTWGFEFEIGWKDYLKNELGYSMRLILSDSQSRILKYSNPTNSLTRYREGQMMGEIWGYTTIGIAKTQEEMDNHLASLPEGGQSALGVNWSAGDIMYMDINGDGMIDWGEDTSDDPGDVSVIGNSTPRYSIGMNFSMNYKGFDLAAFFQGVLKRDVFSSGYYFWGMEGRLGKWFSTGFVQHADYFRDDPDHYLGLNLDSYYPRALFSTTKNQQIQTRYLLDAKYLRLKNLQVGYTLQNDMFLKGSKLRIYLSGENLFTLTRMTKIFDPETVTGGPWSLGTVYPLTKSYSFGILLTF